MRIFIGLACLALVASASFVNKKLSKTNCEYENDNECPNGLDGCCPSLHPYCCPDNIWCANSPNACPAIMPKLIGRMLPKKLPMAKTTSASYVPKKIEKTKRSSCGFEEIDCNDGSCCEKDFPYCCSNKLWCAETPDECPPIKKALPKRLPMVKTISASYVPECDPTEDNVCDDGKGCCGGNFPVCCPNNKCGARGDDC